jgi:hypothetical protein
VKIEITNIETDYPRALDKAKSDRPWVRRLAERQYRVIPRTLAHGKYVVTFSKENGQRFAECKQLQPDGSLLDCPSTQGERLCYHAAACYRFHVRNMKKACTRPNVVAPTQPAAQPAETTSLSFVKPSDTAWLKRENVRGIRI